MILRTRPHGIILMLLIQAVLFSAANAAIINPAGRYRITNNKGDTIYDYRTAVSCGNTRGETLYVTFRFYKGEVSMDFTLFSDVLEEADDSKLRGYDMNCELSYLLDKTTTVKGFGKDGFIPWNWTWKQTFPYNKVGFAVEDWVVSAFRGSKVRGMTATMEFKDERRAGAANPWHGEVKPLTLRTGSFVVGTEELKEFTKLAGMVGGADE